MREWAGGRAARVAGGWASSGAQTVATTPARPGIETGTESAAAGGVTTVVDMPLNSSPCTTTPGEVKRKAAAARNQTRVDVGMWAGLVPGNAHSPAMLKALISAGALGFKAFMRCALGPERGWGRRRRAAAR